MPVNKKQKLPVNKKEKLTKFTKTKACAPGAWFRRDKN